MATDSRRSGGRGGPRRYVRRPRKKVCSFCVDRQIPIDYKNASRLRGLMSDRGKILPRRQTGTCAKHQRQVAEAIKRARYIALLPFTEE
ncbi:MAG: 30S ribosomal protein S18 [Armatimonadetes bacterium CG_4_10_14_3_um_filter_66_18]|jgi:small subunit ribosomal protein S18|nr:30S ribosomal protein S18 [Armatimonadota bacterium]OIO95905.1 MAG: 30S ribosomal protein S18 [Armatimonadetes bacterium CG2_30_66_41]PIU88034.1 MAG: 30S ribosomal protein S18 [Armatimonadetes bacterium CG06_land_8_20_14_3_00_66_21]PIX37334.1 MAG: 30S ribosomal protein S18 [Armatimonadetes bacterium CG_4_8_14_3_um_filter_66_20]PIY36762.1 MAG: 30S ribosomal protein S18 [Armatimonadetes bacterium CG_4_10_14_3_um_filter_66_18]PIZ29403.1 MAG: 30S ribosomal protein S18 [Armatimonadetes bacterium